MKARPATELSRLAQHQAEVRVGSRTVGMHHPVFLIAEIGVNHNGDLELARKAVEAAARAGADAVKFQTFRAEEFISDPNLVYEYTQADGSRIRESQLEMFKRLELPAEWHWILKEHAASCGVDFLSSAADAHAVRLLTELGVSAIKVASEDLINIDLLREVRGARRPVILSTGMADVHEMDQATRILLKEPRVPGLILLHCVSNYPANPLSLNLRRMKALQERYGCPVGFSDHTVGSEAAVIAVAMGACIIEKHFTLDHSLPGPDHRFSADPNEFSELVKRVRRTEAIMGPGGLTYAPEESGARRNFRRSIVARVPISKGSRITAEMLAYRRPGNGLPPAARDEVIGRVAARDIAVNEQIHLEDLRGEPRA